MVSSWLMARSAPLASLRAVRLTCRWFCAIAMVPTAPSAVVTGLALGKYIGCAGSGRERFVIKKLHISRSFPGTGDLYGAVLIGSLIQGNALSAAADNAAEFVSLAIQQTPADQDTRYGVWFEPLLPRLCPGSWND